MTPRSAGILLHRRGEAGLEVLLVHPGGPFWARKDVGAWQLPKGGIAPGEDPQAAARREFAEELGHLPPGPLQPLGEVRQSGGKRVEAFALKGDIDADAIVSNIFEIEWPPRSGRLERFPEVDRAAWLALPRAREMMLPSQLPFLDRLEALLDSGPRDTLRALFDAAVRAVSAEAAMPVRLPTPAHGRLLVIAAGKAAADMMRVARRRGAEGGLVVTRYGHLPDGGADWPGVEVIEAGHPVPDASSVRAAERALELAGGLTEGDHLLVLLSGGGSALLAAPVGGVSLADKQAVTRALLHSGATISEINCVRKHLSRIKGGRLAVAAGAARVTTWIISDVPGDDPSLVASGPTIADDTTLQMARDIVAKYRIDLPGAVRDSLDDPANETPPADSPGLAGGEVRLIARARDALAAARRLAEASGYVVSDLGDDLQSEARELGASHAAFARRLGSDGRSHAIISGGETTVTVTNKEGKGGRNLEYLLGAAIALNGAARIWALACDTDGIDGTEDAAGAITTPDTLARAAAKGLDPAAYLAANDAYSFFQALGDLVITGPTLTNVNDFRVILIERAEASV